MDDTSAAFGTTSRITSAMRYVPKGQRGRARAIVYEKVTASGGRGGWRAHARRRGVAAQSCGCATALGQGVAQRWSFKWCVHEPRVASRRLVPSRCVRRCVQVKGLVPYDRCGHWVILTQLIQPGSKSAFLLPPVTVP